MKYLIPFLFFLPLSLVAQENCYNILFEQGMSEMEADDFDSAIKSFKAAKFCPDKPASNDIDEKIQDAQNGYILAIKAARDEALEAKAEAEKARDEAIAARKELEALTYIIRGQEKELNELFKEAIDMYSRAVTMFPDSMPYYEKRAPLYLHEKIKEYHNAIADYELLIEKGDPEKKADFNDKLAYAYEQVKDFDKANEALAKAVAIADDRSKEIYAQKLDWANTRQEAILDEGKSEKFNKPAPISIVSKADLCNVQGIRIRIGPKNYTLNGNVLKIDNIKPGDYDYEITGKPQCGAVRVPCTLRGKGKIKVVANSVYYLTIDSSRANIFNPNEICKAFLRAY